MTTKPVRFYKLLEEHLGKKLSGYTGSELTSETLHAMRARIRETISGVFSKSRYTLNPITIAWLTDQYFKRVPVSDTQIVNDFIVLHEHPLSEISTQDIKLLHELFDETYFGAALAEELRSRSS